MSIKYQILGKPGEDNSTAVWIDTGTIIYRILLDCGENLLLKLDNSYVKAVDYLLLSHLHLDHISGFDYFFRRNYNRENKPVKLFGPKSTSEIIHHRLRGFKWNLIKGLEGEWLVTDILNDKLNTNKYFAMEGFSKKHFVDEKSYSKKILENKDFIIESALLNHRIPSVAYRITEKESFNIDKECLDEMELKQGAWLEKLKDFTVDEKEKIEIENKELTIGDLRDKLLIKKEGDNLAYLTDFIFDDESKERAIDLINGCDTVICECQYKNEDIEFANKNYHLTTTQTAALAKEAAVEKLILFHISDRYRLKEYPEILKEAREVFIESYFPSEWEKYFKWDKA